MCIRINSKTYYTLAYLFSRFKSYAEKKSWHHDRLGQIQSQICFCRWYGWVSSYNFVNIFSLIRALAQEAIIIWETPIISILTKKNSYNNKLTSASTFQNPRHYYYQPFTMTSCDYTTKLSYVQFSRWGHPKQCFGILECLLH